MDKFNKSNGDAPTRTECSICHIEFENLQEVLKHDLLQHSAQKTSKRLPENQLKRRVNAVLKTINGEDERKFRQELMEAISDSVDGSELNIIFRKYLMGSDDLTFIYSRVYTCLKEELDKIGDFDIDVYGSIAIGLAFKTSDIDFHISSRVAYDDPGIVYKKITKMLFRSKYFSDVHPIRKARVPIIKCVHTDTGFSLDINTSEPYGVQNTEIIGNILQRDNRIYLLALFLKIWSKSMHIHGAFNMTNYCLITLVIFYMQNSDPPVLESYKILQRNAKKHFINGINFGLNLRGIPLDTSKNIHQLIKGFFEFYHKFDFKSCIIAPYLGKVIPRAKFINKTFKYPEYDAQLSEFATNDGVKELDVDRPVCVQDMFCLNINVGKCLSETNVEYFEKCIALAHRKCCEPGISLKNVYTYLLVGIIEEIAVMFPTLPTKEPNTSNNVGGCMSFDIIPRKNELKSLAKFTTNPLDLQKLWAKEYTDIIVQIITDVYRIDMTLLSPTRDKKYMKIDETDKNVTPLPSKWSISCYVDLWSGRQMQRNSAASFMDYQLAQTEKLSEERRQNSSFAVQFKGDLTISVIKNYSALRVEAGSNVQLCKKDPLRKFFSAFKCTMQNYNLKHRIHQLEEKTATVEQNC